ncbi:MAG: ribosomal protein S18-alanine N-acetyltransferase [Bacillota bacterium]
MAAKTKDHSGKLEVYLTPMREDHVEEVYRIEKLSFPTPWPRISFIHELQNELAFYLVALLKNKEVVGYAGMWLVLNEAHVTNLAVHPGYRGLGIGRALMNELIFRAAFLGAVRMTLEVRASNKAAIGLYKSLGFEQEGRRKGYYEDTREDALIMWKELIF